jgi:hypothetical protein
MRIVYGTNADGLGLFGGLVGQIKPAQLSHDLAHLASTHPDIRI